MTKTRQRLRVSSVLVVAVFIACGRAENDGEDTSTGGQSGSTSNGGRGTSTTGGSSGGATATSGGRSPATGGVGSSAGGTAAGGQSEAGASGTASGGGSVGGDSGAAGAAGAGGSGGTSGAAGAGGASPCPVIKCAAICAKYWVGQDGCGTCACEPPAANLSVGSVSCPNAALTLTAMSSNFIGGLNRWLLDFDWTCSDMTRLGEPARAHLQVGILQPLSQPIDEGNRTFFYPKDTQSQLEYELRAATVWVRGSGVPEIELKLQPSFSFLSVRIEGGQLVGGVEYTGTDQTKAMGATLAGPFSVAIPPPI